MKCTRTRDLPKAAKLPESEIDVMRGPYVGCESQREKLRMSDFECDCIHIC